MPEPPERRALVLGVNGQDGHYLARSLLDRGYRVWGVGRQSRPFRSWPEGRFAYIAQDLREVGALSGLIASVDPHAIFHVAAVHGAAGFRYEDHWHDLHLVNTVSVHAILEALRTRLPDTAFFYASSAKVFGPDFPDVITEASPVRSACLYSTSKNASRDLIHYYRARHGVHACIGYLFNHESPLRGSNYFIPTLLQGLADVVTGRRRGFAIGTLGFWSDWGAAAEYAGLMVDHLEKAAGIDLVYATGRTVWAETLAETLFDAFGRDWREHVEECMPRQAPPPRPYRVDNAAMVAAIGRTPARTIEAVCRDILEACHAIEAPIPAV